MIGLYQLMRKENAMMDVRNEAQKLVIAKMDKLYQEEIDRHIERLVMILPQATFESLDAEVAMVQYKGLRVMWSNNTDKMKIITKDDFNRHHNMSSTIKLL